MKKILIFIAILILSCTVVFADVVEASRESLRLSVTTVNTLYLGVSYNNVVSTIVPDNSNIFAEEKFYYDARKMSWYTPSMYFFVISFVQDPVRIRLTTPGILAKQGGGTGLEWSASGDITGITPDSAQTITLKTETRAECDEPRVYCWELKMEVPGEAVIEGIYSGTFTLEVQSV